MKATLFLDVTYMENGKMDSQLFHCLDFYMYFVVHITTYYVVRGYDSNAEMGRLFIHAPHLSVSIIKVASVQLSIQMKPDNNSTESRHPFWAARRDTWTNFFHWSKGISMDTIVASWRGVGKWMDGSNVGHQKQLQLPDWEGACAIEGSFV